MEHLQIDEASVGGGIENRVEKRQAARQLISVFRLLDLELCKERWSHPHLSLNESLQVYDQCLLIALFYTVWNAGLRHEDTVAVWSRIKSWQVMRQWVKDMSDSPLESNMCASRLSIHPTIEDPGHLCLISRVVRDRLIPHTVIHKHHNNSASASASASARGTSGFEGGATGTGAGKAGGKGNKH